MVNFLEAFITGGFFDYLLGAVTDISETSILALGAVSSVAIAIVNIFVKAVELDDFDFCLCLQAMEHYHVKKEFTEDDILEWFSRNDECSLHDHRWNCLHYEEYHICTILNGKVPKVISSLMSKGILEESCKNGTKYYTLKR